MKFPSINFSKNPIRIPVVHLWKVLLPAWIPVLMILAGCASTSKDANQTKGAIEGQAYFRTWLIPRTFDTARVFRFYSLLPERPAKLSAERVASTQMDYLVLQYENGSAPRETVEPFTAILEWPARRVLEAGILEMYINGDGSGVELIANGEDAEGAGFTYNLGRVDWEGWKQVQVALDYPTEFYGEKADSREVVPPLVVNYLGIRDVRNVGQFDIVLAEASIVFPKKRPENSDQLSPEEREAIKRNSSVGIPSTDQNNLPVQRPVDTKVRRPRL
jgi:hypothetical protein